MSILIRVVNQQLKVATNVDSLVSGSQEFVKFVFELGEEWDGLTSFAQFGQDGSYYNTYLDSSNSVYLPHEIRQGECTLSLYGTGNDVVATTNYITLKVEKNSIVLDANSTEPSQSLYAQQVDMISALDDRVDSLEETVSALQALINYYRTYGVFPLDSDEEEVNAQPSGGN